MLKPKPRKLLYSTLAILITTAGFTHAQNESVPTQGETDTFSGEGGLGLIINSGNTNNESLNASLRGLYKSGQWEHDFGIDAKKTTAEEVVTAKRLLLTEKSSYTFSKRTYAFEALRYDNDEFSGFDYQASASIGIGWHLLNNPVNKMDIEIGAGSQVNKERISGEFERDKIVRFGFQFSHNLTETTQFGQELLIQSSHDNTDSESRTAFSVAINNRLALKLLYLVKQNSNPPAEAVSIDRSTTINLIYSF